MVHLGGGSWAKASACEEFSIVFPTHNLADYLNLLPGMWAAMNFKVHPGPLR
jgi:hypothetical protein